MYPSGKFFFSIIWIVCNLSMSRTNLLINRCSNNFRCENVSVEKEMILLSACKKIWSSVQRGTKWSLPKWIKKNISDFIGIRKWVLKVWWRPLDLGTLSQPAVENQKSAQQNITKPSMISLSRLSPKYIVEIENDSHDISALTSMNHFSVDGDMLCWDFEECGRVNNIKRSKDLKTDK